MNKGYSSDAMFGLMTKKRKFLRQSVKIVKKPGNGMSRQTGGCAPLRKRSNVQPEKISGGDAEGTAQDRNFAKSREVVSREIYHFNSVGAFKNQ